MPEFYVSDQIGDQITFTPVRGEKVTFGCCPDYVFFVYRWENGLYYVSEAITGAVVTTLGCKTKKQAISEAETILKDEGISRLQQAVESLKEKGFVSPLFKGRKEALL